MYAIGITGQIASGKSTVSAELARLGATVINADEIGHHVVNSNATVLKRLKAAFGSDIVSSKGTLDRRKLGKRAFQSEETIEKLNRIVHPALLSRLKALMKKARNDKRTKLVVVDAALVFDWGLDRELDAVIVIESNRQKQLARLKAKGMPQDVAHLRISRQIPKYRLRKMADRVIINNGSEVELIKKTWHLFARLVQHSGQKFD